MTILAMYIQGDIYPGGGTDPAGVVAAVTGSQLTTPILALLHVNCSPSTCPGGGSPSDSQDGDITFNDTLIVRGGEYCGDPTWPATIKSLRAGRVTKIFASFGGYGVPDFSRIGKLMKKYGTGPGSPLYDNFACLESTLGLDGIDFDDEDDYSPEIVVPFAQMLLGMGLEITFCPYTAKDFWSRCIQQLGAGQVSWLNLQCYAGGFGNDPADWNDLGVPVVAGICADCCCPQTTCSVASTEGVYQRWTTGSGVFDSGCWGGSASGDKANLAGGFMWTYNAVASSLDAYVDAVAAGLAAGGHG